MPFGFTTASASASVRWKIFSPSEVSPFSMKPSDKGDFLLKPKRLWLCLMLDLGLSGKDLDFWNVKGFVE